MKENSEEEMSEEEKAFWTNSFLAKEAFGNAMIYSLRLNLSSIQMKDLLQNLLCDYSAAIEEKNSLHQKENQE